MHMRDQEWKQICRKNRKEEGDYSGDQDEDGILRTQNVASVECNHQDEGRVAVFSIRIS